VGVDEGSLGGQRLAPRLEGGVGRAEVAAWLTLMARGNVRRITMSGVTFPDRMREFFTLREAEREVRALPEEARGALTRDLALASQKRQAAETLWPSGSMAEALRLAHSALSSASSALESFPSTAPWIPRARTIATQARASVGDDPVPELEAEVAPKHESTFRTLIDALIAIEEATGLGLSSPNELARVRWQRRIALAASGVAGVAFLAWFFHTPVFKSATASNQIGPIYGAESAVDGDPATFWGPPDRQLGSIDLTLGKPRGIRALHIDPGNPATMDRGVKDAHIECLLANAVVKAVDVTFPEAMSPEPAWTDVVLDAPKCDRIRISATSFYRLGPAIAEVQLK
jgi:hypothetical protein